MIVLLILTYVTTLTLAAALIATRLRHHNVLTNTDESTLWALGISTAPAVIGFLLLPPYILGIGFAFSSWVLPIILCVAIGKSGFRLLASDWGRLHQSMGKSYPLSSLYFIALAAFFAFLLSMPVIENDALEYATVARFIAQQGGLAQYPLVSSDPVSGLYAPSLHPPLFHLALVNGYAFFGETSLIGQRLLAGWCHLGILLIVWALGKRISREIALLATALVLGVPFLNTSVLAFGIDPFRIATLMAAVATLVLALENPGQRPIVAASFFSALAMWAHSIGLLLPMFGSVVLFLGLSKQDRQKKLALYVLVSVLAGSGWYLRNQFLHGALVSDNWPASLWPNLHYGDDLAARRGLQNPGDRLINGAFRPWTEIALFGPVFWLGLVGLILRPAIVANPVVRTSFVILVLFLTLVLLSVATGSDLAIKNPRYWLTLAPLAALLGGVVLSKAIKAGKFWKTAAFACIGLTVIFAGISVFIRSYGLVSPLVSVWSGEKHFLSQPRFTGGPLLAKLKESTQGKVLSFRPPDTAVYVGRSQLDHFDPQLRAVHDFSTEAAAEWLSRNTIRWAYLPDYTPVTYGYSAFGSVLADPRYAEPVASQRGARLFRLLEKPQQMHCELVDIGSFSAVQRRSAVASFLAGITGIPHLSQYFPAQERRSEGTAISWSYSEAAELVLPLRIPVKGRFSVSLELSGKGIVAVESRFMGTGSSPPVLRLMDGLVMEKQRIFSAQWRTEPGQQLTAIHIVPLAPTTGRVEIKTATICKIEKTDH